MTQALFDLPQSPDHPGQMPSDVGAMVPIPWTPTPSPLPKPGDRLVDRHGRTATVEAVREDGIDLRLDQPSTFGCGTFHGLYPPTWWRDWRKQ